MEYFHVADLDAPNRPAAATRTLGDLLATA
jgi:hypothetical protein